MSQLGQYLSVNAILAGVDFITGDIGGQISPDAFGNINLLGIGGVVVTGAPNTLTISATLTPLVVAVNFAMSPYVVTLIDGYLSVDLTGGPVIIQLPNAPITGRVIYIKDKLGLAAANNITVTTVGGIVLIDGIASGIMNTAYQSLSIIFNGASYERF